MNESKDKIIGIAATAGFHILLIVFLLFFYINTPADTRWSEEFGGVPVMFGNVPDAFGDNEPFGRGNNGTDNEHNTDSELPNEATVAAQEQASSSSSITDNGDIASQDFEETVNVKKTDAKTEKQIEAERIAKEKAEAARIAAIEQQKKQDINNAVGDLFGNGSGDGSRGNTSGTGTQGVPTGNASHGKTSGIGGWGEYDLGGRGIGRGGLVKPTYTANDYGTVVVDIVVDPQGNVLSADIGRGTNTPSSTLKTEALKAARLTKFSVTSKPGNQKGTITYKFNLN